MTEQADNGWGCTFHRHTFQNRIVRDGIDDCELCNTSTPREVYVFDPDYLAEHDQFIRSQERNRAANILRFTHGLDWSADAKAALSQAEAMILERPPFDHATE